jgi:hypothetical protein
MDAFLATAIPQLFDTAGTGDDRRRISVMRELETTERRQQRATRTAVALTLLAIGVYAAFFVQHFI